MSAAADTGSLLAVTLEQLQHAIETRPTSGELAARTWSLAREAVIADIEGGAPRVQIDGLDWHDVRPLLDLREVSPECVDMTVIAIAYGVHVGFLAQHPNAAQRHLVHITARPA